MSRKDAASHGSGHGILYDVIDKLHPRTRQPVEGLLLLLAIVALMWLVDGKCRSS